MMKWLFKWLLRLVLAVVALAVIAIVVLLLSYNSMLRVMIERQIRAQTGMDAEIGRLHVALLSPSVEIQNFKLYNTAAFGGTPFLDIPEIHAEYDLNALRKNEIHLTLLRFNLGELDIVKNQAGQTNIFLPSLNPPSKKSGGGSSTNALADFKKQSGFDFKGIDMLNVSIGKVKFIDLQNQRNNREQTIGIDNLVIPNVKSETDLLGLGGVIALHSDGFFETVFGQKKSGLDALKQLGL
jgi:uncharacterized protein involved in outer membrane biogenesis